MANENNEEAIIWRQDLQEKANVSSETIRRWMKAKKLPAPDVNISRKTKGWKISTLRAAGINIA